MLYNGTQVWLVRLLTDKTYRMEMEFTEWFKANEKRFAHGQFDEKQIAYSAWLEGKNQALTIPAVMESVCSCSKGKGIDHDEDGKAYCIDCGNYLE